MRQPVIVLTVLALVVLVGCTRELTRGANQRQTPFTFGQNQGNPSGTQGEPVQSSAGSHEPATSTVPPDQVPDTTGGSTNPEVRSLMMESRIALVSSDYQAAIEKLSRVIEIEPNNVRALYNLGYAYRMLKNAEKAVEFSRKAVDADPNLLYVHQNLGYAYQLAGNTDKAMAEFEDELQRHPDDINLAGIAKQLAGIYLQRNLLEEAFDAASKAVKLAPKDASSYALLASVQMKNRAFDQAITALQKAVELDPKSAEDRKLLGDALWEAGRKEEARNAYNKAIELDAAIKSQIPAERLQG